MQRFKGFTPEFKSKERLSETFERKFLTKTVEEMIVFDTQELRRKSKLAHIRDSTVYNFIGLLIKDNHLEKQDGYVFKVPYVEPKISDTSKIRKSIENLTASRHMTSYAREEIIEIIREIENK